MTKQEAKEKCEWAGLAYLGYWDDKHWGMKEKVSGLPYHGGTTYYFTE